MTMLSPAGIPTFQLHRFPRQHLILPEGSSAASVEAIEPARAESFELSLTMGRV
jgi:hypothetical protein